MLAAKPGNATSAQPVTATITSTGDRELVRITVKTGDADEPETITATDNHQFWVPSAGGWVDAGHLLPGQWLQTSAGTWVQIVSVQRDHHPHVTTFNLTVAVSHTYYVLAGQTTVLVHNCGGARTTNGHPHSPKCTCGSGGPERVVHNQWGGRGKPATQGQNQGLADEISAANPDWKLIAGGHLPERAVFDPSGSGMFRRPDLIFEHVSGARIYIQTVDVYKKGAATPEELGAALDIAAWGNGPVIMYPKP